MVFSNFQLRYIITKEQMANILTKPRTRESFDPLENEALAKKEFQHQ